MVLFLWLCSQFYLPGKGFTYLATFGEKESARYLPQLRAINHYEIENSSGYDAQYYAQLAMDPNLSDPALKPAVDNLPYRARRILLSWTAYAIGGGNPIRALHVYTVQNIACWLLLSLVLLRWFPATSWGNFFRWFGVLFSYGLCFSIRGSLVDGPSLLFIACGVALAEMGRPWWSAIVLGISGLAKETNLLGGAALLDWPGRDRRRWGALVFRGVLLVLPLAIWLVALRFWVGSAGDAGARNFGLPFVAYCVKWRDTLAQLIAEGPDSLARLNLLMLVALTAQFLFLVLRPRWREPWWRVAISYCVLMVFLGDAVWEGYPSAASRVLLPMSLAFNFLVPRGRAWWIVLLLGNLTLFAAYDPMRAPGRDGFRIFGPRNYVMVEDTGQSVDVIFDANWYPPERSRLEYWRWSSGSATLKLHNPQPFAIIATVSFGVRASDARKVGLWQENYARWERNLKPGELREVKVRNMRLEPGDTVWRFETDIPAAFAGVDDHRRVAFSVRDLQLDVIGRADDMPPRAH